MDVLWEDLIFPEVSWDVEGDQRFDRQVLRERGVHGNRLDIPEKPVGLVRLLVVHELLLEGLLRDEPRVDGVSELIGLILAEREVGDPTREMREHEVDSPLQERCAPHDIRLGGRDQRGWWRYHGPVGGGSWGLLAAQVLRATRTLFGFLGLFLRSPVVACRLLASTVRRLEFARRLSCSDHDSLHGFLFVAKFLELICLFRFFWIVRLLHVQESLTKSAVSIVP